MKYKISNTNYSVGIDGDGDLVVYGPEGYIGYLSSKKLDKLVIESVRVQGSEKTLRALEAAREAAG